MDVQQNSTRVFSILNDNDCPSFVIRQKQASRSPPPTKLPSFSAFSSRLERPSLSRQALYERNSSISSVGSPPLLRYDSSSSKSSSGSMDSTPSPITPAYSLSDATPLSYDALRPDLGAPYLQSPTTITPFMEQHMLMTPGTNVHLPAFEPKTMAMPSSTVAAYPPMPIQPEAHLPTPSLSNHASISSSASSAQSKTSPVNNNNNSAPPTAKKNKYPCPYASSHNCTATFTTSGHAARHGKKHTGEKGVHCPVCNKAFTRKDNMKQHERTHKNGGNKGSEDTRSKAAITKDAQKGKVHKKTDSETSIHTRKPSIIQSPLSEAPSLAPHTADTPINMTESAFYQDPSPPLMLAADATLVPESLIQNSMYPPLGDDTLLGGPQIMKADTLPPLPPTLVRGFSDLDTLAQAAESFDPYYQGQF